MIVLVVGLSIIAVMAGNMAGGADKVIAYAQAKEMFTVVCGTIVQRRDVFLRGINHDDVGFYSCADVFQRVMSAKDIKAATRGPVIGGVLYLLFAFVPMFLVVAAVIIMPEKAAEMLKSDTQKILPTLVMEHMPFVAQVIFFGALLSAIKSCASATLLAPSVTLLRTYTNTSVRI